MEFKAIGRRQGCTRIMTWLSQVEGHALVSAIPGDNFSEHSARLTPLSTCGSFRNRVRTKPVRSVDAKGRSMNNSATTCLLGAIAGDVIGSVYEFIEQKEYDFPLFRKDSQVTDDSVLTIAVADAILHQRSYLDCIREYALAYPQMSYGGNFRQWMHADDPKPYHSFGNGSAMRVSAVGWAFDSVEEVLSEAERSAAVTHNHPEGIKGAQAAALCVYLARMGKNKEKLKQEVQARFGYDLERTLDEIRPSYKFNEICQQTVPEAITAFLESNDYEDAVRKAISLGGDADTLAAITGGIAEAYYGGVPAGIAEEVLKRLPANLKSVVLAFGGRFGTTT
jgi:ADP-ribosyl-[dinitrogen reductase] hydrolase